jgi:hypothetical protein
MKKHIFSSNLLKNQHFFQILKTNDNLNYLAKSVEELFSNPHFDASESEKNTFFGTVTKVENFGKKRSYLIEKES